jgi:hypothetical protein
MAAQEIQSHFPWEDAPISTADRRRSERKNVRSIGKLTAPAAEKHLHGRAVTVVDLSLHGAGFLSPEALTVGGIYGLQVTSDWMNLSSRVRVASCRKRDDGEFDVGAEFA